MENRKKISQEKKTESLAYGYEDLLDGFSIEEEVETSKKSPVNESPDMDDQALAELLGDEVEQPIFENGGDVSDTALEEDSDLEKEFEKLDLSSIPDEFEEITDTVQSEAVEKLEADDAAEDSTEPDFKKSEFVVEEDQGGYASLLSQLEKEEPEKPAAPAEGKPEADFTDMDLGKLAGLDFGEPTDEDEHDRAADQKILSNVMDTGELPSLDDEPAYEPTMMNAADDQEVSANIVDEPEKPEQEVDFLGLSGIPSKPDKSGKPTLSRTEVLFDGVEMDFDEQIDSVTFAELLLAQGKRKEAAEVFHHLSEKKGVTHWVGKRLRMLVVSEK